MFISRSHSNKIMKKIDVTLSNFLESNSSITLVSSQQNLEIKLTSQNACEGGLHTMLLKNLIRCLLKKRTKKGNLEKNVGITPFQSSKKFVSCNDVN